MLQRTETCPSVKYNWLLIVKNILLSLGFGDVCYCQKSKHHKLKTKDILKQRLTDCFQQECDAFFFLHFPQTAF